MGFWILVVGVPLALVLLVSAFAVSRKAGFVSVGSSSLVAESLRRFTIS